MNMFQLLLLFPSMLLGTISAFMTPQLASFQKTPSCPASTRLSMAKDESATKRLVLVTFDLDDTLYPIAPVIQEANAAFARAMDQYGYKGIKPQDIDLATKQVRAEMDPKEAAALSHTEARELAIRRKMEEVLLERKLKETAEDWVTSVEDLAPVVLENAKRWTTRAISPQIVQAVLTAWEMERHHAAERHLYPEVQSVLQQIQKDHPGVVIGAVTDGKANPMLMTFTLAPYFDFCMSWEDDQKGRSKFFQDLSSSSTTAELSWIYNAAVEKGQELACVQAALKSDKDKDKFVCDKDEFARGVWIHVGDDLGYDVGGSAACGAKTILCELANEYKQTARQRFDNPNLPSWSTTPSEELEIRRKMNEAAKDKVTERVNFIREIPDAVNRIVAATAEEEDEVLMAALQK